MDIVRAKSPKNHWISRFLLLVVAISIAVGIGVFVFLGHGQTFASSVQMARLKHCQPGKQASLRLQRVPPGTGTKLRSKVLVLACGSVFHYGSVEIVGYDTSDGFCYATDSLKLEASEGGLCVAEDANWQTFCENGAVCSGNVTWTSVDGSPYFQLSGLLAPEVTRVRVTLPKSTGGMRIVGGIVGKPNSKLRRSLNLDAKFGIFALIGRGCPPAKGVKVVGYDNAGNVVGASRSVNLLPGCSSQSSRPDGAMMVIRAG